MDSNQTLSNGTFFMDSQFVSFVSALIMLVFCIVGVYGNIISAIIFCHPSMRAPINVLLTAASLIDMAVVIFAILFYIMPNLNMTLRNDLLQIVSPFIEFLCYPFGLVAQTCSIYTFVLVSIERYLAVCQPLKRDRLLTCRKAKRMQIAIVAAALTYNLIRFWEYKLVTRSDPEMEEAQFHMVPLLRAEPWYFFVYYIALYIVTQFLVPFAVIVILNAYIIRSLAKTAEDQLRRCTRKQMQQRKTTQMMVVITLMFAVCNTPPILMSMLEVFDKDIFQGEYRPLAFLAMDVSNILVVLNSSSTFLIYMLYCRKYRALFLYYALEKPFFCFYWNNSLEDEMGKKPIEALDSRSYVQSSRMDSEACLQPSKSHMRTRTTVIISNTHSKIDKSLSE